MRRHHFIAHKLPMVACIAIALAACTASEPVAQLGSIDFSTSGSGRAQEQFTQGVLYLHSFEYALAGDAFRSAQETDPDFAMAYWGEAMTYTHPIWDEQDVPAARNALERLAATPEERQAKAPTDREKAFLSAIEVLYGDGSKEQRDTLYSRAMARLSANHPDDPEAKTFYALSLLGLSQGNRVIPTYVRAGAIAQEVFDNNRDHPGAAHYIIHSFDDPTHAPLGLTAARAYSRIAPGAGHAQHMTSHIFVAMGMWEDVVMANEQAAGVINTNLASEESPAYSCGHYNEWLEYGYLQQGRFNDGLRLLNECMGDADRQDIARNPRASYAYIRALNIVDSQNWEGDVALGMTDSDEFAPRTRFLFAFGDGYAAAQRGDLETARNAVASMAAITDAGSTSGNFTIMRGMVEALIAKQNGQTNRAVQELQRLAEFEEGLPFAFGPPGMAKPPRELLGDVLLEIERPADAMTEYSKAYERTPRRAQTLLGLARAAVAIGRLDIAADNYEELRAMWGKADPGFDALAEVNGFLSASGASQ